MPISNKNINEKIYHGQNIVKHCTENLFSTKVNCVHLTTEFQFKNIHVKRKLPHHNLFDHGVLQQTQQQ